MMQSGTTSRVRAISGSEMPSRPMMYRLLMTSIQFLSTTNCSEPASS